MTAGALPNVIVLESIHPAGIEILAAACTVHQLSGPADPALRELLPQADAIVVRSTTVDSGMLATGARLRVVGRHGAGTDNIDLDFAKRNGITVVNTPRSNTESVAEYVITVALMMLKRIPEVSASLASGRFRAELGSLPGQVDRAGLVGREAQGTVLGLVGAGAIGRAVARRAKALGMVVRAFDPFVAAEAMSELGIEHIPTLDDLLRSADIVSLHVPGGGSNTALVGDREFALMPPGSLLINAARGDLVDADALAGALIRGHIAAAAVDVHDPEPPLPDSVLLTAPNIIATPHMAAMTREALRRMSEDVASAVVEALLPGRSA